MSLPGVRRTYVPSWFIDKQSVDEGAPDVASGVEVEGKEILDRERPRRSEGLVSIRYLAATVTAPRCRPLRPAPSGGTNLCTPRTGSQTGCFPHNLGVTHRTGPATAGFVRLDLRLRCASLRVGELAIPGAISPLAAARLVGGFDSRRLH